MTSELDKKYPVSTKLAQHTDEWSHIYPFMEWLQYQKHIILCRYQTDQEAKEHSCEHCSEPLYKHESPETFFCPDKSGFSFKIRKGWRNWRSDIPIRIGKSISDLLHEYFEVDQNELERERRAILEELRKKNAHPNP